MSVVKRPVYVHVLIGWGVQMAVLGVSFSAAPVRTWWWCRSVYGPGAAVAGWVVPWCGLGNPLDRSAVGVALGIGALVYAILGIIAARVISARRR